MKRGYSLILTVMAVVVFWSGEAWGVSSKAGVMGAKSGRVPATSLTSGGAAQIDRLAGAYRSGVGKASKAGKTQSLSGRAAEGNGRGAGLSQWPRSRRPYQIRKDADHEVHTHLKRGTVAVKRGAGKSPLAVGRPGEGAGDLVLRYVAEHRRDFGLKAARSELKLVREQNDDLGCTHLFFQQRLHDIPVWGKSLVGHIGADGQLDSINCLVEPSVDLPEPAPNVWADEVIGIAEEYLKAAGNPVVMTEELAAAIGFEVARAKLYYWQESPRAEMELVWVVEIRPNIRDWMRFFVAASDGFILEHYNASNSAAAATAQAVNTLGQTVTIGTYEIGGTYYMIDGSKDMFVAGQSDEQLIDNPQGVLVVLSANNQDFNDSTALLHFTSNDNSWSDPAAVSALDFMSQVYDFYRDLPGYSRNSFDNAGKTMIAIVHVTENGQSMPNAYWNGYCTVWGDGGQYFEPLSGARDVVGHEFTHAVVQYTANLEYKFQSGALNETYADIGGVSVDDDDFLIGEDVAKVQHYPTGALRDMADPHNGGSSLNDASWQPAHMDEYVNLTIDQDRGGVHVNNGITNLAAYKIFAALGVDKAQRILYCALDDRLHANSDFTDFRIAAAACAVDNYGAGSAEETAVKQAFDEVGIAAGSGTDPTPDRPVVTGSQYIVMANDEFDFVTMAMDHRLIISDGFDTIDELAEVSFWYAGSYDVNVDSGRPIAVDPYGQAIYYVSDYFYLVAINPDGTGEEVIDYSGDWWSLALSPSGRYLAMTRSYEENTIWLYDFSTDPYTLSEMTLLHPTTDHGGGYADIVDFADSLVFIDDRSLAYDCVNTIQSPGGEAISFWDVNIIDILTGQIDTVLPPQATGTNVGNPIVASTNPTILAVEFFHTDAATDDIVGINLITGAVGTIVGGLADVAYPDYAPDDNHMLYTVYDTQTASNDVYMISLGADKISSAGAGEFLLPESRLPVWFVVGDPPTAEVSFAAAAGTGSEALTAVAIPVTLTGTSEETVTVDYTVTGGNAMAGSDYTLEDGTLTFDPGESSGDIPVSVIDDSIVEGNESFTIMLSGPVNTWLGGITTYTYTIIDDELPRAEISFGASSSTGAESLSTVTIPVSLTATSADTITVDYAVTSGAALAGSDYTLGDGTLTYNPGESSQDISITVIDDTIVEGDESLTITLSRPINALLGGITTYTYTITDDDKITEPFTFKNNKVKINLAKGICKFTGTNFNMAYDEFDGVFYVRVYNEGDAVASYEAEIDVSDAGWRWNKKLTSVSYKNKASAGISSVKINFNKRTVAVATKGASLGALDAEEPIRVEIETDSYLGYASQ